jgi:hypothetical protein
MVLKREICFVGDSRQADYPNLFGSHRNACVARLRSLGYIMAAVGPTDDGSPAYPARLHFGVVGRKSSEIVAALAAHGTAIAAAFSGVVGTRPRPIIVANPGVNDIGADSDSAATVLANNALIAAQYRTSVPDAWLVWDNITKPGAGAAGGYGSNGSIYDTYRAAFAAWAAIHADAASDAGTSVELRVDEIHFADTLAGSGVVGIAQATAIASLL